MRNAKFTEAPEDQETEGVAQYPFHDACEHLEDAAEEPQQSATRLE
jgi:hypothetical protein